MGVDESRAPAPWQRRVNRRLVTGLLLSLLAHAFVLSLRFGLPGLGLPGAAPPIHIVLSPAPPVAEVPSADVQEAPPALAPTVKSPAAGITLVDPAPPPPPVTASKARKARRVSVPLPVREAPQLASRVVSQDLSPNAFVVPLAQPDEARQQTIDAKEAQHGADEGSGATMAATRAEAEAAEAAELAATAQRADEAARQRKDEEAARQLQDQRQREEDEQRKAEQQKAEQVRAEQQRADQLRLEQQRAEQVKAEQKREEQLKHEQQKQELQRAEQLKAEQKREEQLQLERQRAEQLKQEQQRAEQLKVEQKREEQIKREQQKAEQLKLEQQRAEQLKLEQQRAEQLKLEQQRIEQQRIEQQRIEQQRVEQQRIEQQRVEQQRIEQQRMEQQRIEQQKIEQQRAEQQRAAADAAAAKAASDAAARAAAAGATSGSGGAGGNVVLPKSALGSDVAARARELSRGIDLLGPPPAPLVRSREGQRRVVVGAAERDVPLRMYVESFRQKIERNGNLNYAPLARRVRIDPLVSVTIASDGSVVEVTLIRSSGRNDVDEAVRRIVSINARYSAFPPNIAARYDVIEIRRVWSFEDSLKLVEEVR